MVSFGKYVDLASPQGRSATDKATQSSQITQTSVTHYFYRQYFRIKLSVKFFI